jgi:hypothetical protein
MIFNDGMQVFLNKGIADTLVGATGNFGAINLSVNVNSAVFTYERLNHRLSIFFNGVFLSSSTPNPDYINDMIDWSTSDNLYINKSHRFYAINPVYYHKITAYDKVLTPIEIEEIYENTKSLLEVDFLQNAQNRFQSLGLANSVVTTSSQSFTFNADNQFVTIASNVYLNIKPSNWSALVPAIQASSQIKFKLFIPSGTDLWKFLIGDYFVDSGFYIRLYGNSPNTNLEFLLMHDASANGGRSNYAQTVILNIMSIVPDLFDVEHEWRFEHKNLTGDPDGYVEQEIYCDDVLLKRAKSNFPETTSAQKAIGFNQGTGPDNLFSIRLGQVGTRVSYITINEKPV